MPDERKATAGQKRTVHRSPRYPVLTLGDAVHRAKIIYEHDKRSLTKSEVLLGHLGIKPGTGTANRILSSLKQYGFLDEQDGRLRISDTAFKVLHLSDGSPEKIRLIREAAIKPWIVQEVLRAFPGGLPSDANLGDFLVNKKHFNPDSAPFFVGVLRDNLSLSELDGEGYGAILDPETSGPLDLPPSPAPGSEPRLGHGAEDKMEGGPSDALRSNPAEISTPYNYPLSKDCMGIVRFRGRPTQADIDRLVKFLELGKLAFPESVSNLKTGANGDGDA